MFNCHEAWVHRLRELPHPLDIVVGLKGRHVAGWDYAMRPLPTNARTVHLGEALANPEPHHCIVAHNLTDLLDVKQFRAPRLLVLHATLDGIAAEQRSATPPDDLSSAVARYVAHTGAHVIAVSRLKAESWGLGESSGVVPFSADPADYGPHRGDLARGLRIANHIARRPQTLRWDFHEAAFGGLPMTIVGHNDEMPGVRAARDWDDLKEILSRHRFYVHTADPRLEDGYNMATLEAMAAGLAVLGNRHPTSPIEHGVDGFLSDDPGELRSFAEWLLRDAELAARMGRAARESVARKFPAMKFRDGMLAAIRTARETWNQRRAAEYGRA